MIIDKLIPTKLSSKLIPYYENLGYEIPRWVNPINNKKYVKKGTIIWVSTLDLPEKSNHVIEAQCDYCEEIYTTKRSHISDPYRCACAKCSTTKAKDTMIKMYGVDNAMRCQQFVDKFNFTIKKKYGVNNVAELDGIKEKRMQTCTERYQVPFPLQNNAIKEKSRLTCLEKYGVQYSFLSPDVQNKIKNAIQKKYAVEYISQSEEIKEKVRSTVRERYNVDYVLQLDSVRKNLNPRSSRQQEYICNLYNGVLNYPFSKYNFDILIDNNIDLEIDFGGHDLQVKLGKITKSDFEQKELIRNNIIKRAGYKIVRYVSKKDNMPDDIHLIQMLQDARRYFQNYPNHSWITFDIDDGVVYSAEYKKGELYNFGKLYKLSKRMSKGDMAS